MTPIARAAARRRAPVAAIGPWPDLDRRLRLDSGRELARGAARPEPAAARHPRAARGGERLCRRAARADRRTAKGARSRDAGAAQGGRQRAAAGRRTLRLLFALSPRRPASNLLPQAARRRRGDGADRRRRARRGQGVLPPCGRQPFARPYEIRLERRRTRLRNPVPSACATSSAARTSPTGSSTRPTTSSGRAIQRRSSMSSRTRTIDRSA